MKNTIFLWFLLLVPAENSMLSQNRNVNGTSSIGFRPGVSYMQVKDHLLNGLTHAGPGLEVSLLYSRYCCNFRQDLELSAGMNFLTTSFENEIESYFIRSVLQYSLTRKVDLPGGRAETFLGSQVKLDATQGIYSNWDVNHFYWLTGYSVGFQGLFIVRTGKRSLAEAGFGLPLLTVVSRTPANQYFHEADAELGYVLKSIHSDPVLQFASRYFNPELKLGIQMGIGEKRAFHLLWKFSYTNNSSEGSEKLSFLKNTMGIGFLF